MSREDYVKALEKMYKEYYTGEGGHCRYFEECKKDIGDKPCKFASDKAMVGEEYGNNRSVPRLVFVGIEGLHKDANGGAIKDIYPPSYDASNSHYRGLRYVMAYLLCGIFGKNKPCDATQETLNNYNEATKYVTLLNFFKCAFGEGTRNLSHTSSMEAKCQEILLKEIEILEPNVLVIQVKNRPAKFDENFKQKFGGNSGCIKLFGDAATGVYQFFLPSGKPFVLILTYHPAAGPYPSWVNDNKNGNIYINKQLKPVLDKAIEAFKKSRR